MIADQPPPLPAAVEVAFPSNHLMLGVANPEWAHIGIDVRGRHLGYGMAIGTIGMASDFTGSLRYFWTESGSSPFAELGGTLMRAWPQSGQTPQDWYGLGFLAVGYRLQFGRYLTNLGIGLTPLPLPPGPNQSIFVSNASILPRVLLQVGYAL